MNTPTLTLAQVSRIRTAGLTDVYFSKLYQASRSCIRKARCGETYLDCPTPPDIRPRAAAGRYAPPEARLAPELVPKPTISQALRGWRRPYSYDTPGESHG